MINDRGNTIPNQFIIRTEDGQYFQSYKTLIAFIPNDPGKKTILDADAWDYSVTTGRYRNIFLGEYKRDTERKIKNKTYKLKDLNNG